MTKCPVCQNEPAIKHKIYGVLPGKKCQERRNKEKANLPPLGQYRSIKSKMEHYATPFWKIMGLPPKPEEKLREREMNRRGITYLDLQKKRVFERKKQGLAFDSTKLKQQLMKGELSVKKPAPYRKLRASGN